MNHSFLEVNIMGIVIFILLLFHNKKVQNSRKSTAILNKVIVYIMLTLLSDMLYFLNERALYPGAQEISGFLMVVYFVSTALSSYYWLHYTLNELSDSVKLSKPIKFAVMAPMLLLCLLSVLSPFTGWIFFINDENVYIRGALYFMQPILAYGYVIAGAVFALVRYTKEILKDRKRSCIILSFYTLLPLVGGVAQAFFFGLNTAMPAAVIAIVMLYLDNIKRAVSLDHLTGLNNRGQFDSYLSAKINASIKNDLYLIILDIDHFKSINDTYGHVEGDKSIIEVANVLTTVFASADAFLARYGGDEFTIILDTNEAQVTSYLKQINQALTEYSKKLPYQIAVSAGYEKYHQDSIRSVDQLIRMSDENMYKNKQSKQEQPFISKS